MAKTTSKSNATCSAMQLAQGAQEREEHDWWWRRVGQWMGSRLLGFQRRRRRHTASATSWRRPPAKLQHPRHCCAQGQAPMQLMSAPRRMALAMSSLPPGRSPAVAVMTWKSCPTAHRPEVAPVLERAALQRSQPKLARISCPLVWIVLTVQQTRLHRKRRHRSLRYHSRKAAGQRRWPVHRRMQCEAVEAMVLPSQCC